MFEVIGVKGQGARFKGQGENPPQSPFFKGGSNLIGTMGKQCSRFKEEGIRFMVKSPFTKREN